MTVPVYPGFRDIGKEDKPLFDELFRRYPPTISEFTFTNLYSWAQAYNFKVCAWDDFIIVRSDYGGAVRFMEPLGPGAKKELMLMILLGSGAKFIRIGEGTANCLRQDERLRIEEDANNFDYIYRINELVNLEGAKFDGKRNLIRKFTSSYEYEYTVFDASTVRECIDFEDVWCTIKDCDGLEGLKNERRALRVMIDNFSEFNLISGGIRIQDKICAIAIAEQLNPDTLVMHILKADPDIPGLYQAVMHEFLKRQSAGLAYLNLEQDLGIDGLRRSKLSYHPVSMVKKYTVSLK